ncbi:hypothetical protein AMTRI_Chr01g107930 [Amborella trichopoda]|uniref:RING-type domain-containing protein n=1 Tax=Amborella trichopoda TaxID=13333 RepID=W1P9J6_AMBTC|nr:RING-H2 finger protein ATL67 [Amborella trichopoda]ERN04598.1 hypothetical protein AMTR_s00075p00134690 [Amborella trichopoda]|eukprot:XP_011622828.1 RING-H2 finger protein ATL67 [Amborella trichopoda]
MAAGGGGGFFVNNFSSLGLGYSIAIALGLLVLLSTILLASYICCRGRRSPPPSNVETIVLPRIIFVAEGEEDEGDEHSVVVGLDQNMINSYPKFAFSKASKGNEAMCSICLCEYKEGEMLRMMPDCRHFFHLCCVDAWLRLNASCPVCRTSPLPTPLSTPLSELVPLSHFPDAPATRR